MRRLLACCVHATYLTYLSHIADHRYLDLSNFLINHDGRMYESECYNFDVYRERSEETK